MDGTEISQGHGRRSLDEELDEGFAEGWRPKAGDKLIGVIIGIDARISEWSPEPYPIVTVRVERGTADGKQLELSSTLAFHAYHAVARAELARLRPQRGERIGIACHGKHPEKGYVVWRVVVDRAEEHVDWDRIGEAAHAELRPSEPAFVLGQPKGNPGAGPTDDIPFMPL